MFKLCAQASLLAAIDRIGEDEADDKARQNACGGVQYFAFTHRSKSISEKIIIRSVAK